MFENLSEFVTTILGSSLVITLVQYILKYQEDRQNERRKALQLIYKIESLILDIERKKENSRWLDQFHENDYEYSCGFYETAIFTDTLKLIEIIEFDHLKKIDIDLIEAILDLPSLIMSMQNGLQHMSDVLNDYEMTEEFRKHYITICYKLIMLSENLRSLYRFKKRILYFGNRNLNDYYRNEFGKI